MAISAQVFTLGGVALGAFCSYLVTSLNERTRYRRELAKGWEGRKFDAYAEYLSDVKRLVAVANRIAASLGLHNRTTLPLSQEEGLAVLADVGTRRTTSSERASLLANEETLAALRELNETAWRLECFARGLIKDPSTAKWKEAMRAYWNALNAFHRSARKELGVPGRPLDRPEVSDAAEPLGGLLESSDADALHKPVP